MAEINRESISKKFFFSMTESELYDATIQLTVPYYDLIHAMLIDILNYHFGIAFDKDSNKVDGVFIDVGVGTGKETLSILKAFPKTNVIAIDIATPMEKEFAENYIKTFDDNRPRFSFLVEDFLEMKFNESNNYNLGKFSNKKRIGAFSAYCLHHFDFDGKKSAYQKMFDFLESDGIMVNIDLFNYENQIFSNYAHHFDIEYITNQFDNPNEEFKESKKLPLRLRQELKTKWIKHMNEDNILHSVDSQITMLKEIGFKSVECPFRYFQQGIIVAVK